MTLDYDALREKALAAKAEHAKTTNHGSRKWRSRHNHPGYKIVEIDPNDYYTTSDLRPADSDWIAHAHEQMPELADAVLALLDQRCACFDASWDSLAHGRGLVCSCSDHPRIEQCDEPFCLSMRQLAEAQKRIAKLENWIQVEATEEDAPDGFRLRASYIGIEP